MFIIQKIHSEKRSSVVMVDGIKGELARSEEINWYSVQCSNFGMLHFYSTVIGTEKRIMQVFFCKMCLPDGVA